MEHLRERKKKVYKSMPVIMSSFAGSHGTTRWSTGILEVIFSTIVNLAIENGRGAMGNFGSDDNCANCLPPPTRQKPSGLKVSEFRI